MKLHGNVAKTFTNGVLCAMADKHARIIPVDIGTAAPGELTINISV